MDDVIPNELNENKDLVLDAEEEEHVGKIVVRSKKKCSYEICKPLVVGSASTIYLVHKLNESGFVKMAMKAENADVTSESTGFALANEIRFLVEFKKRWRDQVRFSDHLVPICDFGHSKKYKFMIQPLLGPNLDQLRDEIKSEFSTATAARLSLQALDAVSMLHQIKMLHTRVEPAHFCIGTDHRRNVLYLVGLGHITTFGKKPTWNRKAQYAPRPFASKSAANMELECWFLTMMDLFDRSSLPWNKFRSMSRETIEERKLLLFSAPMARKGASATSKVPSEVRAICAIMSKPNYKAIDLRNQLIRYLNRTNVSLLSPYEWEESTPEYRACKNIRHDPAVYEKNVKTISRCTSELLKDYTPPKKKDDDD